MQTGKLWTYIIAALPRKNFHTLTAADDDRKENSAFWISCSYWHAQKVCNMSTFVYIILLHYLIVEYAHIDGRWWRSWCYCMRKRNFWNAKKTVENYKNFYKRIKLVIKLDWYWFYYTPQYSIVVETLNHMFDHMGSTK